MNDDNSPFCFNVNHLNEQEFAQLYHNIEFPQAGGIVERDPARREAAWADLNTREL